MIKQAYDVKDVINQTVDEQFFWDIRAFGAILWQDLQVKGKQPLVWCKSTQSSRRCSRYRCINKGCRFIRFCDAFNIPILTLKMCRLPAVLIRNMQHNTSWCKIALCLQRSHSAKDNYHSEKSYGGAFIVMNSNFLARFSCWPSAEIAVMGPMACSNLYRKELLSQKIRLT